MQERLLAEFRKKVSAVVDPTFSPVRGFVRFENLTLTIVCGHPNRLQIRSHVSKLGERAPASSSRYSMTLTPSRHAACPTDQPT